MEQLIALNQEFPALYAVIVVLLGLCSGSFVTLASYRIPLHRGILWGRSRCPSCGYTLRSRDLIPLLSWVFSRARCRNCGVKISARYPLTELATCLLFYSVFVQFGISHETLMLWLFVVGIMVMIVVDFEHSIIPDSVNTYLAIIGVAWNLVVVHHESWIWLINPLLYVAGALALRAVMSWWKGVEALGLGDVKFFGVAGLFLTAETLPSFFFFAGILGMLTAIIWRALGKGYRFPFGPSLALSLYLCIVWEKDAQLIRQLANFVANQL